jgi:ATP-dependent protease ClpP protease subunit
LSRRLLVKPTQSWAALASDITRESVDNTINALNGVAWATNPVLVISSSGGNAQHGFRLCEYIEGYSKPLTGLVSHTDAKSMAALVLLSCSHRVMVKNACLHFHHITARVDENASQRVISTVVSEMRRFEERQIELIKKRSRLSSDTDIRRLLDADRLMNSAEALELGFVDEVVGL